MKRRKLTALIFALVGITCTGCNSVTTGKTSEPEIGADISAVKDDSEGVSTRDEENKPEEDNEKPHIHVFKKDDVIIVPEIKEYDFDNARKIGMVKEIDGILPGASGGTWYTIVIDGIEYYYGKYDFQGMEDTTLYGYSIVSDEYSLKNGISVNMTEDEILEMYPNMAVIDFEDNYIYREIAGNQGWNGIAYPRSYMDMDSNWDYEGKDYYWTNQFDYVMIADIDMGSDTLPTYVALLIKDHLVAAITIYYPTAG